VAGNGTNPANAGDFGSILPSGTIVFAAGETSKTLTVNVKGDTVLEANEGFNVTLSNPTNGATINTATADGFIVDDDFTAAKLGNALIGTGVNITNASYTGTAQAAGIFNGSSLGIGIDSGIVLSSGNIVDIYGPNTQDSKSTDFGLPGDVDLNSLVSPRTTQDASVLEFDFIPADNLLSFQYVFASEEYNEFVGSSFNDVFGFFLTDSNGNKQNIAVVPGAAVPIAINNINGSTNSAYYRNNDISDFGIGNTPINTQFDGATTVLTAVANVTSGQSYHFKLAIADTSDYALDSAVFITSGTFTATSLVAIDDSAKVTKDTFSQISVLENDVASAGSTLAISSFNSTTTQGGSVSLFDNGTSNTADDKLVYTPALGFVGFDSFEYVVTDNNGHTDTAIVSVQVEAASIPVLEIVATNAIQAEGDSGTKAFTFTVSRSGNISGTNSVNWTASGEGANPANANDFGGVLPSGTVDFAAGESSKIINVNVKSDTLLELDEGFNVALFSPTNGATISTAVATGMIINDDVNSAPTLTTFASTVATGDEDTEITVTFANLQAQGDEADIDGTVTAFVISAISSGSLKIGASAATATAWAAGINDVVDATNQAFWTPAANANGSLAAFTVVAKDNNGLESATAIQATVAVMSVNDSPTGSVTITGTATQNQTLTAANTLADVDGLGTIAYQWLANGKAISGATTSTLTLGQVQVGKTITVKAAYTDLLGTAESISSAATGAVVNVNDAPTGTVTITGNATQNQTLTAANTLADVDGLGTIAYQWLANGTAITGATASTLTLGQAQVGKTITVKAAYADLLGTAEIVSSAATGSVVNVNDTPTGTVTISGTATQNQTLTASNTLADVDGLGAIAYQWLADGTTITGATASTLTLAQAQVGKAITVQAGYTDLLGAAESVSSVATTVVANANDLPTGAVTITGTATQNKTLTASNTLADVDGLGTIAYQWLANGTAISGATAATLMLGQAQVGKTITVKAAYTDLLGTAESVSSTATLAVINVNDAPTGTITITGTATQNQTLTAANTLADVDGLGTIAYQWLANGTAITGATASTLTLAQAQVGKAITVQAGYTDLLGTAESVSSVATLAVVNVNDAPTGAVTITGTATQNQTLTASNTLADVDGLGTIAYQWLANGTAISGATASTLTLGQAQVGKTITVKATYTDLLGTAESVSSTATLAVINVNDAPTGTITITGTATQNQTLTAANTLADIDGLGTITYQWLANGTAISGATTSTLTLSQAQVGKTITVQASYTDLLGTAESVTSLATAPTSSVTIIPTVTVTAGITPIEGAAGSFIVTLDSPAPAGGLTINYNVSGTATLNTDYTVSAGTNVTAVTAGSFTVAAGQTTANLMINASNDDLADPNETIKLSLSQGTGYQFSYPAAFDPTVNFATGYSPWSVSVGDFNGDGKIDLAVANRGSDTVSVLLRNASNTGFDPKVDVATGTRPSSVSVGDFNGDGKTDLAVANYGSNTVSVLLRNAANAGFEPKVDFATGSGPFSVSVGDFNGDGKTDLAVTNLHSDTVSVLLRNAANTGFEPKVDVATGSLPDSVSVGDFNGDGKTDLATANLNSNTVSVLLRNAANTGFDPKVDFATGSGPISVSVGDFNGDGKLDLAVANAASYTVSVLLRNAANTGFDSKVDFAAGGNAYSVSVGDFNGDGKLDLAVANEVSGTVSVLLNSTLPSAMLTITDNAAPTLTAFASTVASGNEDSQIAVTFASLQTQGNEADVDGTINAFVIKAVSTGSLKIGTSAATATTWNATSNNTVDTTNQAFWTPAANANGSLNAFTVVAKDNNGVESATAIQATVAVTPVSDAVTINLTGDDDFYQGSVDGEIINGLAGDDVIYGRDGDDRLVGGTQDDTLYGGSDNDVLEGGSGDNQLFGGSGDDILYANSEDVSADSGVPITVSNQTTIPSTGQSLSISLTTPPAVNDTGSVTVSGLVSRSAGQSSAVNIAYVIDVSGSMGSSFQGATVGDLNNDGSSNTLIDAAISSFDSLTTSLKQAGFAASQLALIPFAAATDATIDFNDTLTTDANNNGILDVIERLHALQANGASTNFTEALNKTIDFFTGKQGANYVFFISDGMPNEGGSYASQVQTLINASGINATIKAIGLGAGASLPALDLVDDNTTNNTAVRVDDPTALTAGLVASPVTSADIDRVELYRNGVLLATIPSNQLISTPLGLKFSTSIPGLDLSDNSIVAKVIANDAASTSVSVEQHIGLNSGGAGDNLLSGGSGNDILYSGAGDDELNGGSGGDAASYTQFTSAVNVNLGLTDWQNTGAAGLDKLVFVENLIGGSGNDQLIGNGYGNVLNGGAGADKLTGGLGNDTYIVDNVGDIVTETSALATEIDTVNSSISYILTANVENLTLTGTAALNGTGNGLNNTLIGNEGDNTLNGGAGADKLIGGLGTDTLTGGAGLDIFVFNISAESATGLARDNITDFTHSQGDKINLGIDANTEVAGDQGFTYIGATAFTGVAGQLDYLNGILSGDTNGDKVADFEIAVTLVGGTSLVSADFNNAPVNTAPVAVDDILNATENTKIIYSAAELLGNDTDVEGDALAIASVTSGNNGTAELNADGTVSFTSSANFNGVADFSYVANDGMMDSNSATVTINVAAVNHAPTGTVTIAGTATQNEILTASNNLADIDGLGTIAYQWLADGFAITGATASTMTLGQAQVGKTITVTASYTDLQGSAENVTSTGVNIVSTGAGGATYDITEYVTFWKTGAALSGVTSSLVSNPVAGSSPIEFKNLQLTADGGHTLEIWETSTGTDSLGLQLSLPTGSAASWQDSTELPTGWTSLTNTATAGHFELAGMGLTPLAAGAVKLGVLTVSNLDQSSSFKVSLIDGSMGEETVSPFTMTQDITNTGNNGLYQHTDIAEGSYNLTTTKAASSIGNAIKANDALAALKIAVGINPNTDGSAVSSYQYLAADINHNGKVSAADALNILKMAVNLSTAPEKSWLFVPETVENDNMSRANVIWSDTVNPLTVDHNQTLHLVGIVSGDVNGSWVEPLIA